MAHHDSSSRCLSPENERTENFQLLIYNIRLLLCVCAYTMIIFVFVKIFVLERYNVQYEHMCICAISVLFYWTELSVETWVFLRQTPRGTLLLRSALLRSSTVMQRRIAGRSSAWHFWTSILHRSRMRPEMDAMACALPLHAWQFMVFDFLSIFSIFYFYSKESKRKWIYYIIFCKMEQQQWYND